MRHEEYQYLDLLKEIHDKGVQSKNRTKVDSTKVFGRTMRFDLSNGKIPVFTTKKLFFKGVVHELLWFMRGETHCKYLQDNGVHIWDLDAERYWERVVKTNKESLKNHEEKDYKATPDELFYYNIINNNDGPGELGPIYGSQWRNFNHQGVDQLAEAITKLQNNPNDRRIIVSAWNPAEQERMGLPPCHILFQFGVEDEKYLTCALYQRSCDMFLGVPFNVASYSLLTHLLAKATGLEAKEFVWFGFDCHIYNTHEDQVLEQIIREPYEFPTIKIDSKIEGCGTKLLEDGFLNYEDISLENYKSHDRIKAELADY